MKALSVQKILENDLKGISSRVGLPEFQIKGLSKMSVCRTKMLGGHAQYCSEGHLNGVWYNSCKHRACPQCRGLASEQWLRNTRNILLDSPHHHVIFTLPSSLNSLWRYNREQLSDMLFRSVHETLKTFSKDPRYLGAMPGVLSVLHTWGRNLSLHPHIHALISHGGLDDHKQWVEPKKSGLFPRKPVMMVFRGKFLDQVRRGLDSEELVLPDGKRRHQIDMLLNKLGRAEWVVHFCKRYDYADGVAKYLARYVKGGPFKNSQLKDYTQEMVSFSYQSHQSGRREKLSLSVDQFSLRLAEHIPCPRKPSVRYGGLYASSARKKLNLARSELGQSQISKLEVLSWQNYLESLGYDPKCEVCGLNLFHKDKVAAKKWGH